MPPKYLLDEDLSHDIAEALKLFGFGILHVKEVPELGGGTKEPDIFKWCRENKRVWISHDIEAKRKHETDLFSSKISVLWVRLTPKEGATWTIFKLIVRQIDRFQQKLTSAHGAIHYKITRGRRGLVYTWAESSYDKPR